MASFRFAMAIAACSKRNAFLILSGRFLHSGEDSGMTSPEASSSLTSCSFKCAIVITKTLPGTQAALVDTVSWS